MALTVKITDNAAAVARKLADSPAVFLEAVRGAMDATNARTVAVVQRGKLTAAGPKYLNVRTGRLRRSANATPSAIQGLCVRSSVGSNVSYARVHEFGFRGTEQIRAHVRRVPTRNFSRKVDGKRQRAASGVAFVRAHARRVDFRERLMFRDALDEQTPDYARTLSAAVVKAWGSL